MVISTPRLCHDVAFLPPEKTKPHAIACTPVVAATAMPSYLAAQETKAAEADAELDAELIEVLNQIDTGLPVKKPQRVGDIEIGAHVLIPKGKKIEKSAVVGGGKETLIATIAKSDGFVASDMEMRKVGIKNGNEVDVVKKEVERVARGKGWRLDVVETPRGKELRGVIEADDDKKAKEKPKEHDGEKAGNKDQGADAEVDITKLDKETIEKILESTKKEFIEKTKVEVADKKKVPNGLEEEREGEADNEGSAGGSEERYKEEL
jgi:protein OS-9